jgi:hypothetical protein
MIRGATEAISGNTVFKRVLKQVYAKLRGVEISYLQIYQKDAQNFVIAMEDNPHVGAIRSLVEAIFNRQGFLPQPAKFELMLLDKDEVAKLSGGPKFSLFSNTGLAGNSDNA